jgi:hypothetical protein
MYSLSYKFNKVEQVGLRTNMDESDCDKEGLMKAKISSSTRGSWCHVVGNDATSMIRCQRRSTIGRR